MVSRRTIKLKKSDHKLRFQCSHDPRRAKRRAYIAATEFPGLLWIHFGCTFLGCTYKPDITTHLFR